MINNCVKIIDEMKKAKLPFIDEFDDDYFVMGKDFMRFKFRTDDKLVFNREINIPVCVISLSGVIKKGDIYYQ